MDATNVTQVTKIDNASTYIAGGRHITLCTKAYKEAWVSRKKPI
jgi:hypothetical protein